MLSSLRLLLALFLLVPAFGRSETRLRVAGLERGVDLGPADLARLPAVEIVTADHGQPHHYRGVAVRDILALVDAPLGPRLRGPALACVVRARGADGYVAAFALAEFDAAFREQAILLTDTEDGKPLPPSAGPFRLICPGDQRAARWVRQVIALEVVSLAGTRPPKP